MKGFFGIMFAIILTIPALHASEAGNINAGNSYFKKGDYEKSLGKYRDAEIEAPTDGRVHFNIGDALYKMDKADEADSEFKKALAGKDKLLKSKAYYNLGNVAYKKGNSSEALDNYKKALILNPGDSDAKYNIEYILNQKNIKKDKKNDINNKDGKDNKQEKVKPGQLKEANQGKDNKKQGMSKEDAKRLMDVFNDNERESAKKRKMSVPKMKAPEEDW